MFKFIKDLAIEISNDFYHTVLGKPTSPKIKIITDINKASKTIPQAFKGCTDGWDYNYPGAVEELAMIGRKIEDSTTGHAEWAKRPEDMSNLFVRVYKDKTNKK